MYAHATPYRIPYADTDQMGYMYYGNYAKYYEAARTEALRSLGLSYKKMEEEGIMLTVVENDSRYLAPAGYDELISVRVLLKKLPSVRWEVEYEIFNEAGRLIHTGRTVLVFISKESRRPCRATEEVLRILKEHIKE